MASTALASRLRSAAKPKQHSPRNRAARKRVSYREKSSDNQESDVGVISTESSTQKPVATLKAKALSKRKRKTLGAHLRPFASAKKTKVTRGKNSEGQEEKGDEHIQYTGKTMPWSTLPYQILLTIFDYASRPLTSDTFMPTSSIAWLLRAGLSCKAFLEPALSVLYFSPPLTPPSRAQTLIENLAAQNEESTLNYRAKIRYLEVEASSTLMYKYAGQDPIDLGRLVGLTPQLRSLKIHLLSDDPKFRKATVVRNTNGKCAYQQSIFSALEAGPVMLRSWVWNQALAKHRQNFSLASLKDIHKMLPFQNLQDISFVNYENGPVEKGRRREDILEEAINALPSLTSLQFKMSSIVNSRLLSKFPGNLRVLEIVDCSSLKSPALNAFLNTSGRNLRQLILDHNHSLNLSFLITLAADCPKLEILKMDLRYFNTFFTVRDSDPKYDSLFRDGEIPAWPNSLQRLELFHLRKWSLGTAELFFSSLTQAAESLSDLRQLRIKASLEESGWRERIGFRDTWTKKLQDVFQRNPAPPNPHLRSITAFTSFKKQQSKTRGINSRKEQSHRTGNATSQLSHVEIPTNIAKSDESDSNVPRLNARADGLEGNDSDPPLSTARRSKRVKPHQQDPYILLEGSPQGIPPQRRRRRRRRHGSDDSSSEDSAIDDDGLDQTMPRNPENIGMPTYIQGMCDVVDILIDNLRPTEEQLNEDDFLDDEVSGDEDWNGDDDMPDDGGYAW